RLSSRYASRFLSMLKNHATTVLARWFLTSHAKPEIMLGQRANRGMKPLAGTGRILERPGFDAAPYLICHCT
ncbi:hypothetical protein J4419_05850, partial [Candidatus Woesearchaeota archaeon]|nr:hypothetical protein [Candidatus Woesearchaeota archaeon]